MRRTFIAALALLISLWAGVCVPGAVADLKEWIGFSRLQTELGTAMPTGSDILVTQLDAIEVYEANHFLTTGMLPKLCNRSKRLPTQSS